MSIKCPVCGYSDAELLSEGRNLYRCRKCRHSYADRDGSIYPPIVKKFEMGVTGFFCDKLHLVLTDARWGIDCMVSSEKQDRTVLFNIDNSEFRCFCSKLFDDLLISDWKKSWYSMGNGSFVSWDINVSFEKKHTLSIHGCNSLPYYWQELMDLVKPYFSMIDVDIASFFPSEPQ